MRRGEVTLFYYGHITYTDVFDKERHTYFCYQYGVAPDAGKGVGHSLTMYDEHNDAD